MSENIVLLDEKLSFGKNKGCTGRQLLQCADGTKYLVWLYNNTDIRLDSRIVDTLAGQGLVKRKLERQNSLNCNKREMMQDAHNNAMRNVEFSSLMSQARAVGGCMEGVPIKPDRECKPVIVVSTPSSEGSEKLRKLFARAIDRAVGKTEDFL